MYTVTAYYDPFENLYHTSYAYSGLLALARRRQIRLRIRRVRQYQPGSLCVSTVVIGPGKGSLRVTFDLRDRSTRFDQRLLQDSNVYFKRSYHGPDLSDIEPRLRSRILPFGLNYVCGSPGMAPLLIRAAGIGALDAILHGRLHDIRPLARSLAALVQYSRAGDYEYPDSAPKDPIVVYQTRLWRDDEAGESAEGINDQRARLVRGLRSAFGPRFRGGLVPNALAISRYPDLIGDLPYSQKDYIRQSRTALIGIYSRGLHFSTAWKFGEYLASSSCIVAEPPRNTLPEPLVEGSHYLSYRTPEECVAACERILQNPDLQADMRSAAFRYYLRNVEPGAHMQSCLERAYALAGNDL